MSEVKPRGLLGYMKEKTALPGEDLKSWATQWSALSVEDKETLLRWAHEQGDTNVAILKAA